MNVNLSKILIEKGLLLYERAALFLCCFLQFSCVNRLNIGGKQRFSFKNDDLIFTLLENDPRPSYKVGDEKEYGMRYAHYEIFFRVTENVLHVTRVTEV